MKLGIIREGKVPPDKRVPLTPAQCARLMQQYPHLDLVVQPSPIRAYKDSDYAAAGVTLQEDLSDCDVIMGVKEVPKPDLIAGKTYFYFSHTIKMQPYNQELLRRMLDLNIRMVDYETITNDRGSRLIGFGRYAGVVGCFNAFRSYGLKTGTFNLKPANQCADRKEMEAELEKVKLPENFKIVLTGLGRVGGGAREIIDKLGLRRVSAEAFVSQNFGEPVFTQLSVEDYNARDDGGDFTRHEFYDDPIGFHSVFMKFAAVADVYVACHYWDSRSPFIFTRADVRLPEWGLKVVADISCDIDGPVATTLRPSTIAEPIYGYNPQSEQEGDFFNEANVGVMAVDNLPCELPKDASEDFGEELIKNVIPHLLNNDQDGVIARATICENGELTENYAYLNDYVEGKLIED